MATQGANNEWNSDKEDDNVKYEHISCYSMDEVEVRTIFLQYSECTVRNDSKSNSLLGYDEVLGTSGQLDTP